ncbi:cytochrome c oxidase assembly factor Coa1 family protein [Aequorivita sp. SDUM287046]|uniref:Cytochrome c oxidase assembly factor Coa1 family protein n=1 Tax=Aequorivita aurantiaca TaxID=3053356 RepID=A0ABT8DIP9_9FLAO|nr:cytochrome c oxidase assembly factor Coa1 family protein [Aequorivita aurantiaca]MDN3724888.1 cytochrome c oxidase assembly factor Coa1 family protein [Aequorivita aurantiaca]
MNNELINQKTQWQRNWKWFVPVCAVLLISITVFFTSGMGGIATDLAQAYADTEFYEKAIKKAEADQRVQELLGNIQPIDKMAILEGETEYTNNNRSVNSTIRIIGTKSKARMDITANRANNVWVYSKINIRITSPPEKKQTIVINTEE